MGRVDWAVFFGTAVDFGVSSGNGDGGVDSCSPAGSSKTNSVWVSVTADYANITGDGWSDMSDSVSSFYYMFNRIQYLLTPS